MQVQRILLVLTAALCIGGFASLGDALGRSIGYTSEGSNAAVVLGSRHEAAFGSGFVRSARTLLRAKVHQTASKLATRTAPIHTPSKMIEFTSRLGETSYLPRTTRRLTPAERFAMIFDVDNTMGAYSLGLAKGSEEILGWERGMLPDNVSVYGWTPLTDPVRANIHADNRGMVRFRNWLKANGEFENFTKPVETGDDKFVVFATWHRYLVEELGLYQNIELLPGAVEALRLLRQQENTYLVGVTKRYGGHLDGKPVSPGHAWSSSRVDSYLARSDAANPPPFGPVPTYDVGVQGVTGVWMDQKLQGMLDDIAIVDEKGAYARGIEPHLIAEDSVKNLIQMRAAMASDELRASAARQGITDPTELERYLAYNNDEVLGILVDWAYNAGDELGDMPGIVRVKNYDDAYDVAAAWRYILEHPELDVDKLDWSDIPTLRNADGSALVPFGGDGIRGPGTTYSKVTEGANAIEFNASGKLGK